MIGVNQIQPYKFCFPCDVKNIKFTKYNVYANHCSSFARCLQKKKDVCIYRFVCVCARACVFVKHVCACLCERA
jgi:hypothetical protein